MSSRMVGQRTRGDEYNEIEKRKIELEEQLLDLQERRLDIEQKRIELELRKLKLVKGDRGKSRRGSRSSKRSSSQAPREESGDEDDPRRLVSSVDSDDDDEYQDRRRRTSSRRTRSLSRNRRRIGSYDNASTDGGMTTDDDDGAYTSQEDDDLLDDDEILQELPKPKKLSRSASEAGETSSVPPLPPSGRGKLLKRNASARDVAEASTLPPLPAKSKSFKRGSGSPASPPNTPKQEGENLSGPRNKGLVSPEAPRRRRSGRRGSAPPFGGDEAGRKVSMQQLFAENGGDPLADDRSTGSQETEKRSNKR